MFCVEVNLGYETHNSLLYYVEQYLGPELPYLTGAAVRIGIPVVASTSLLCRKDAPQHLFLEVCSVVLLP